MTRTITLALIGATLATAACAKHAPVAVDDVAPVLTSARLYYDDGPAFQDSLRLIVRDLASWREVWWQATSSQASPPARPPFDFARDMAIIVGAGRMSPGDLVHVDSAGIRRDRYVVVVSTILECDRFPGEAYPLEIVRVPRQDRPVEWVNHRGKAPQCMDGR